MKHFKNASMDVDLHGLFEENGTFDYTDYIYEEDFETKGSRSVLIPVVFYLELIIGLLGNGLLLATLALKRRSWRFSDTLILHLTVSDVLLLLTLPYWGSQGGQYCGWCLGGFLCKLSGVVFKVNFYCGIFLLLCISLDCYLSVSRSSQLYSLKRPRLVHISCLVVWLTSLILTIPDWVYVVEKASRGKAVCVYSDSQSASPWQLVSRLLHHTLGFVVPAAALIICCSCILLRLQRSAHDLQRKRAIMVILPLVGVFFLCWLPYNITLIVDTIIGSSKEPGTGSTVKPESSLKTAVLVTSALGCSHACLRPLLYLGLCANFRKRVVSMLTCAKAESDSSLWELGMGEEAMQDQSHEGEKLNQITSVDHQVQAAQC